MINKINYLNNKPVNMKQAQASKEETATKVQQSYVSVPNNGKGMEALGNYGMSMVNFANKLNIEPLIPTIYKDINAIEGERIYTSDGKIHSIVKETPTHKTTYFVPIDNQNAIDYIETIDKNTGKIVRNQHNQIDKDGKYSEMYVTTFNPNTGNEEMYTSFKNGKLDYAGKTSTNKFGEEIHITKYSQDNDYFITQQNKKTNTFKTIWIKGDMKTIDYSEQRNTNRGSFERKIQFYEGLPFNYEESKKATVPNLIGIEPLMDPDLKPAPKFDFKALEMDIRNAHGEETRYSNGALETKKVVINGEEMKAFFNPKNEIIRIVSEKMEIEADGKNAIRIKQNLGEGITKETFISKSMTQIVHKDNGYTKALAIDNNTQKPMSYHENKTVNGKEKDVLSLYFNKAGVVESIYT